MSKPQRPVFNTQFDAIFYYVTVMDADGVEIFLENNKFYANNTKTVFMQKLRNAFEKIRNTGETELVPQKSICTSCIKGAPAFIFMGELSKMYLSFLFELSNDGTIVDMYDCTAVEFVQHERFKNWEYVAVKTFDITSKDIKELRPLSKLFIETKAKSSIDKPLTIDEIAYVFPPLEEYEVFIRLWGYSYRSIEAMKELNNCINAHNTFCEKEILDWFHKYLFMYSNEIHNDYKKAIKMELIDANAFFIERNNSFVERKKIEPVMNIFAIFNLFAAYILDKPETIEELENYHTVLLQNIKELLITEHWRS
jgi:hypothetical protein